MCCYLVAKNPFNYFSTLQIFSRWPWDGFRFYKQSSETSTPFKYMIPKYPNLAFLLLDTINRVYKPLSIKSRNGRIRPSVNECTNSSGGLPVYSNDGRQIVGSIAVGNQCVYILHRFFSSSSTKPMCSRCLQSGCGLRTPRQQYVRQLNRIASGLRRKRKPERKVYRS